MLAVNRLIGHQRINLKFFLHTHTGGFYTGGLCLHRAGASLLRLSWRTITGRRRTSFPQRRLRKLSLLNAPPRRIPTVEHAKAMVAVHSAYVGTDDKRQASSGGGEFPTGVGDRAHNQHADRIGGDFRGGQQARQCRRARHECAAGRVGRSTIRGAGYNRPARENLYQRGQQPDRSGRV